MTGRIDTRSLSTPLSRSAKAHSSLTAKRLCWGQMVFQTLMPCTAESVMQRSGCTPSTFSWTSASTCFDPEKFEDHYEEALTELINAKRQGKAIGPRPRPSGGNVVDLMDALKKSLETEA